MFQNKPDEILQSDVNIESGIATGGSQTTLVDITKSLAVDIWKGAFIEIVINEVSYIRTVVSNTATTITFATLPGVITVVSGNAYNIKLPATTTTISDGSDVALGAKADAPSTYSSNSASAISLLKGVVSYLENSVSRNSNEELNVNTVEIASGVSTSGSKTTLTDSTKDFEVNSLANATIQIDIGSIKYFRKISSNTLNVITFAALPGSVASAAIGSGANGTVTISSINENIGGNSYTVQALLGVGINIPLSVLLTGLNLVVTLATNGGGTIDMAANTASLIATAVAGLAEFTAVASGTGLDTVNPTNVINFTGGIATVAPSNSSYKIINTKSNVDSNKNLPISQSVHDNLNANVNLQVSNTDTSNSNPVPVNIVNNLIGSTKVIEIQQHFAKNTAAGTEQTAVRIPKPTNPVLMYKVALTNSSIDSTLSAKLFNRRTFNITGTAQTDSAPDNTHIVLAAIANPTNDHYNTFEITITAGTGIGQTRTISAYVGANTVRATVSVAWVTIPDNTSVYSIAMVRDCLAWTGSFPKASLTAPIVKARDSEVITGLFDEGSDVYLVLSNDTLIVNADASRFTAVFKLIPLS